MIMLMIFFPILSKNDDLFFIVFLTVILLFFIFALRKSTGIEENLKNLFSPSIRKEIFYVFAINMAFAFIFTCVLSWADLFIGLYDPSWVSMFDIDSVDISAGAFIISAIGSIFYAPLIEELVFRGVLFNRLKIRIGIIPAMIISSLLFGIGHDFGGITSAFLFGICMCILYLKTDNIFVPMSVHFINNVVAVFFELIQLDSIICQFPLLILTTVIVVISMILIIKYIVQEISALNMKFS